MGIQPSASVTGLLLLCQRPFDPEIEIEPVEPSESARYGSAWHWVTAECFRRPKMGTKGSAYVKTVDYAVTRWEIKPAAEELARHVRSSLQVLHNWLKREKLEVVEVEKSYSYNPTTSKLRETDAPDEDHRYPLKPGEIGLTLDLYAYSPSRVVVIDHKTGWHDGDWYIEGEGVSFALPHKLPQMKTVGTALSRNTRAGVDGKGSAYRGRPMHVGIFHADRRGLPMMHHEELEIGEMAAHDKALAQAIARVGDKSLRPGPHCVRCPARVDCPAQAADLLGEGATALMSAAMVLGEEPVDTRGMLALPRGSESVEKRASALWKLLKRFEVIKKAGHEEIRRLVKRGGLVEVDGQVLELREESFEMLSKASIYRALGRTEGDKLIKRLRAKGVVEQSTREKLVAGRE